MSTTSSNVAFSNKYQQLIIEYTKLRNQVPILKKAVLAEQERNAGLTEEAKSTNQRLRKCDSEIESLNFRNEQLVKRVESLQSMLEDVQKIQRPYITASKKANKRLGAKLKLTSSQSEFFDSSPINDHDKMHALLKEELQQKLAENERLHSEVFQLKLEHEKEKKELLVKIEALSLNQDRVIQNQRDVHTDQHLHNGDQLCTENHNEDYVKSSKSSFQRFPLLGSLNSEPSSSSEVHEDSLYNDGSNFSSITNSGNVDKEESDDFTTMIVQDLRAQLLLKQKEISELKKIKDKALLDHQFLLIKFQQRINNVNDTQPVCLAEDLSTFTTNYYEKKLTSMCVELQQEQSKSAHYENECRTLLTRLKISDCKFAELQNSNVELSRRLDLLKDEAETTRCNYENQMKTLSECLAQAKFDSSQGAENENQKPGQRWNIFR